MLGWQCPDCGAKYEKEYIHEYDLENAELDFWECCGAEEGCVFCPECACEFKPQTKKLVVVRKQTKSCFELE